MVQRLTLPYFRPLHSVSRMAPSWQWILICIGTSLKTHIINPNHASNFDDEGAQAFLDGDIACNFDGLGLSNSSRWFTRCTIGAVGIPSRLFVVNMLWQFSDRTWSTTTVNITKMDMNPVDRSFVSSSKPIWKVDLTLIPDVSDPLTWKALIMAQTHHWFFLVITQLPYTYSPAIS